MTRVLMVLGLAQITLGYLLYPSHGRAQVVMNCDIACRETTKFKEPDPTIPCLVFETKDCLYCVHGGCDQGHGPGAGNCRQFNDPQRYKKLEGCTKGCVDAQIPCEGNVGIVIDPDWLAWWWKVHTCESNEPLPSEPKSK